MGLGEQLAPHFLTQHPQRIELLVVELPPAAHSRFADFRQPRGTIPRGIDLLSRAGNAPATVDGFQSTHDSSEIFTDGQVTACQLLERPYSLLPVADRGDHVRAPQFGQLPRIDAITLAAFF